MIEKLEPCIERFLRTGSGDFDALSLEVFARQFEKNLPYQAFCRASGKTPEHVARWQDIPAVPIAAFKSAELVTFPTGQAAAVFHSSGTTQKTPSQHFLKSLTYYETALGTSFQSWMVADQAAAPFLILAPAPREAPHSSLSWMLDVVKRTWGAPGSDYFVQRGFVEDRRLFRALGDAQAAGKPVVLLGTTLAFLEFFDHCAKQNRQFVCAPGSRIMDTGGMKTRTRSVSRDAFLNLVRAQLAIPEENCVNEYGMCEMSSQFYARGASPVFSAPPWVRTLAIDPGTGKPVPEGTSGLLRHFDLANLDSVMAIQTEDEGEVRPGGFLFKGRARSAELKGCSVDMEAYLKSS